MYQPYSYLNSASNNSASVSAAAAAAAAAANIKDFDTNPASLSSQFAARSDYEDERIHANLQREHLLNKVRYLQILLA